MKHRNPFAVFMLSLVTLGIYDIYWLVVTKKELNKKTRIHTPTIWLLFAPIIIIAVAFIVTLVAIGASAHTQTTHYSMNSTGSTATASSGGAALGASLALVGVEIIAFLVIVPITFYWFFKFSKAVNEYTNGKMSTGVTFLLLWLLHLIGVAIVQDTFNDMLESGTVPGLPTQPAVAGPQPMPPAAPQAPMQVPPVATIPPPVSSQVPPAAAAYTPNTVAPVAQPMPQTPYAPQPQVAAQPPMNPAPPAPPPPSDGSVIG